MVMQFNFKQILNEMKYLVKLCPDIKDIPYALICPLSFIKLTQKDEKGNKNISPISRGRSRLSSSKERSNLTILCCLSSTGEAERCKQTHLRGGMEPEL